MEIRIAQIAKHKTALTLACVSTIFAILIMIMAAVSSIVGLRVNLYFSSILQLDYSLQAGTTIIFLLSPLIQFVGTYILVFVVCAVYNVVAVFTGGIIFYRELQK